MCYTQNHRQIHEYLICCPDEVLVLVPVKTVELIPSAEAAGHEDEEPARRSRHDHSHRCLRALKRLMQRTVMLGSIRVQEFSSVCFEAQASLHQGTYISRSFGVLKDDISKLETLSSKTLASYSHRHQPQHLVQDVVEASSTQDILSNRVVANVHAAST